MCFKLGGALDGRPDEWNTQTGSRVKAPSEWVEVDKKKQFERVCWCVWEWEWVGVSDVHVHVTSIASELSLINCFFPFILLFSPTIVVGYRLQQHLWLSVPCNLPQLCPIQSLRTLQPRSKPQTSIEWGLLGPMLVYFRSRMLTLQSLATFDCPNTDEFTVVFSNHSITSPAAYYVSSISNLAYHSGPMQFRWAAL